LYSIRGVCYLFNKLSWLYIMRGVCYLYNKLSWLYIMRGVCYLYNKSSWMYSMRGICYLYNKSSWLYSMRGVCYLYNKSPWLYSMRGVYSSWWRCSVHPTTAGSLTTQRPPWLSVMISPAPSPYKRWVGLFWFYTIFNILCHFTVVG